MNEPTPVAAATQPPATGLMQRLLGYLESDPDNVMLRADIFDLALAAGQFETAQAQTVPDLAAAHDAFTHARRLLPSHIGTWHGLGWCEILRQDLTAARLAFDAALALDRNFGESDGALAVVLALQGRTAEAAASIRRASKLSPGGLSAHFAHAVIRGDIQDREKFLRLAREALSQHPGTQGKTLADLVLSPMRPMHRSDSSRPGA